MKNHKSKVLALCVATALLYGCGSDSNSTMDVQAYDGPVRGMIPSYSCDNGSNGTSDATNDKGIATIEGSFADNPESCTISFKGGSDAIDMENGRDMSGVQYSAPKGLFTKDGKVTVSPLTTLIDKQLNGAEYNESTATEVLADLGLDEIPNNGVSIQELLSDTESAVTKLKGDNPTLFSKLAATKMILSDVVQSQPDLEPEKLAAVTKKLSDSLVSSMPNFPLDNSGKEVVVNLKDKLQDTDFVNKVESGEVSADEIKDTLEENLDDATKPEPTDPDTPATGGTGGTGSAGTGA
ncbi:hypothetical protein [Vibrio sp.]|uniref:hypothetical protein n=1 Tax=Vibrio sp. TaxID=678 RepID=UPI003AA961F9